jgi:hypothetical protein
MDRPQDARDAAITISLKGAGGAVSTARHVNYTQGMVLGVDDKTEITGTVEKK